jgi:glycosyltransferase involved in cell wall biosynthesis
MIFSIVTPSLNCGEFIRNNFASIHQQGFGPNELEHWVIDGGSSDGTVAILKAEPNVKWISEPDKGLSDAVNKGIQRAKGEWIIWLNADDLLADSALNIFLEYARKHPEVKMFEGAQTYLGYDDMPEQTVPGSAHRLDDILGTETGMNQASLFVHREVYQKVGLLNVNIRYAMDYEWLVRAAHHFECVPIKEVLTFYRRRPGSIMDAHMVKHFQTFLDVRRRYNQPRFCRAEFRILFYIYTDRLRKIRWLRKQVRQVKGLFGAAPLHPMH